MIFYVCFLFFIFISPHGKVGFRLVLHIVFPIVWENLILLVSRHLFQIYFQGFAFRFLPAKAGTLVCNS